MYLHVYDWPENGELIVPGLLNDVQMAAVLSDENRTALPIQKQSPSGVRIDLAEQQPFEYATVVALQLHGQPNVASQDKAR